ncbi:GumC family protein [Mucilaginibacter boryungensis]|uniref:non-specific protein-tyrosine kinase n=1 Tax=Mucilaginibacter boryungensis TaxID=768480 RepID=A0ABR9XHF6_9SPHI|nr:tyrosine-protein kinase family protein [Mucilaginibacter boryungensis]MBE9666816.1 polysaccharide biosynthesis tyrosine autokinase [Mucilaginibacter boryungensis]
MISRSTVNNKSYQTTGSEDAINLRALLVKYADYWQLFLVSFIIALIGVIIYKKYVQPSYDIVATLEIQDISDKSPAEKTSLVDFQQLDQVNAPRVVENEMEILRSNQIIKQVVDYFQLWADYKLKGGMIKDPDLYGNSPIKMNLLNHTTPILPRKLQFQLVDANTYALIDDDSNSGKHHFGEMITDKIGSWTITANNNLKKYIGSVIEIKVNDPDLTVLNYQSALKVEAEQKPATVINISITDKNIKRGQDFINYLIYFYKQNEVAEKNKIAKSTLQFIDDRLDSLSGQLNHAENKIEGYRSQNELTDVNAQSQMYLQQIQANGEKLNDIGIQLSIINKLDEYLNQSSNNNSSVPSTLGITDQHLVELVQKLSDVQLEKNRLLATLPEKNPAFDPLNSQISALKTAIKDNIKSIKSSLLTTQNSLQGFKSTVQSSIKNVPVQEHQLAGMGRQQSNKETLYKYLLQQREQIALTYASSTSNVRLVDAAHILPLKASKKYIPFGAAFLFALIFPVGFIYGKDVVKNAVNNRKEIERHTGIPVLSEFSYVNLTSPIVFNEKTNKDSFILIEQFRHLRSRLTLLQPESASGTATLITSSVANEGKSFISSNLAISLANASKKTVLLEVDIYKPNISKTFGLTTSPGLTNYLKGKVSLQKIIQKCDQYPNLSIISSGDFIDDFSELLDQEQFQMLVEELKAEYDYVLFDTPPVHSISDALSLARYCDNTLYVVRYDQTSRSLLPFIQKLHTEELLPKMNIIFNGLAGGRDSEGLRYENYYKNSQVY